MVCQVCGRSVQAGDRFCTGCGVSLAEKPPVEQTVDDARPDADAAVATASDDEAGTAEVEPAEIDEFDGSVDEEGREADPAAPTQLVELVDDDGWGDSDPVWAPTAPNHRVTTAADTRTADLPTTEPITEVWPSTAVEADATAAVPAADTDEWPEQTTMVEATAQMPSTVVVTQPIEGRLRLTAATVFAILAAGVLLAALFTTVVGVESTVVLDAVEGSPPDFRTGEWIVDDLADNLAIGGLLAAVALVVGAVAAIFRWRWGSGLAGGAGLGATGLAVLAIGLAQAPIDAAHEFARIPNEQVFTLTITRDVGYWLFVVAAVLGVLAFFASLNDASNDQRPGLNPWIAALGALATVIAAFGPLIPENLADFSDNWYVTEGPGNPSAMLLAGRLVQLGLLALTGLVGFLSVRRWGLGVAIGGAIPTLWLAVTALIGFTDDPAGPGYRNPGAANADLHGVTIIGVSAVLAMWVLAAIAAYDQGIRERR